MLVDRGRLRHGDREHLLGPVAHTSFDALGGPREPDDRRCHRIRLDPEDLPSSA
jgi:hypothetical protein